MFVIGFVIGTAAGFTIGALLWARKPKEFEKVATEIDDALRGD